MDLSEPANGYVRNWLGALPWATVEALNKALCAAGNATHGRSSEGYEKAKALWRMPVPKATFTMPIWWSCAHKRIAPALFCSTMETRSRRSCAAVPKNSRLVTSERPPCVKRPDTSSPE